MPLSKEDIIVKVQAFAATITPMVILYTQNAYTFYKSLPEVHLQFIIGAIMCFFGGVYPALFAAIEAAKHGGMDTLVKAFSDLSEEALVIIEASKKDDAKDEDNNGVNDVQEIDSKQLILRKTKLVLAKMNPEKVNSAMASIYKVWLAVMAVLSIQFARTIALSVSISKFLNVPIEHAHPFIKTLLPSEYHRWIPIVSGWVTKSIAMSFAFYLQSIITALTSALTGALIMSRAAMKIMSTKGYTLGGLIPVDHKDTLIDEVASYGLAFLGFTFQWKMNFSIPFPLNLFLVPVQFLENCIRWSITNEA